MASPRLVGLSEGLGGGAHSASHWLPERSGGRAHGRGLRDAFEARLGLNKDANARKEGDSMGWREWRLLDLT